MFADKVYERKAYCGSVSLSLFYCFNNNWIGHKLFQHQWNPLHDTIYIYITLAAI